jgi:hypothetical protein
MKKVAVAGAISPRGLGDALQYYILIRMLDNFFSESEITFICPQLKDWLYVFRGVKLNAHLVDLDPAGHLALWHLLRSTIYHKLTLQHRQRAVSSSKDNNPQTISKIIRAIGRKYEKHFSTYTVDQHISSGLMRHFAFNAGIFGGHTICGNIYHYILEYKIFRSTVKGPLTMSPISISNIAFERFRRKNSTLKNTLMVKRLKNSLQEFDFIYARGPYSLKTLRNYLNINEEKTDMALDSGFGLRLFYSNILTKSKTLRKEKPRIVIIPRKDFFYAYNKENSYELYLKSLVDLIVWLFRNFDVEVYLASQTAVSDIKYYGGSDQAAIQDVLDLLKKRDGNKFIKHLKIVKPDNLVDACRLYGSADLVLTSRMHGGITALGLGVLAFFILPSADIKVLDVLSFIGLDIDSFFTDAFNANSLRTENILKKVEKILQNLKYYKKIVESAVNGAMPTVELPVRTLINLLE